MQSNAPSEPSASPPQPHPLARQLAERVRDMPGRVPILEVAQGSGRNTRYFVDLGIPIVSTRDDEAFTQLPGGRDLYAGALSTHGYLHGTRAKLVVGFGELRRVVRPKAPIYITLGSIADARYGLGEAIDDVTFAPGDGEETGIPHPYFDRDGVIELLRPGFRIESLEEHAVDDVVGRWAHAAPIGMVHWFVIATRK